jgi:hypothetical protein
MSGTRAILIIYARIFSISWCDQPDLNLVVRFPGYFEILRKFLNCHISIRKDVKYRPDAFS